MRMQKNSIYTISPESKSKIIKPINPSYFKSKYSFSFFKLIWKILIIIRLRFYRTIKSELLHKKLK